MEILNKLFAIDINYIIIGLIVVFYTMEQVLATQFKFDKLPQHLFHNVLFQVAFYLGNLLWAFVTVFTIEWLNKNEIGLLYLLELPLRIKLVLGVMLFDFVNYWFHRTAHLIPCCGVFIVCTIATPGWMLPPTCGRTRLNWLFISASPIL
jgi:sterol desaturase/sphingolipid hydroxylase (fatty acid hydroxylase superfamily)